MSIVICIFLFIIADYLSDIKEELKKLNKKGDTDEV